MGNGYVWTGNDDERYKRGSTVSKLDPATNRVVGEPVQLGSPQSLAFGEGAVWDTDHSGWLVKIDPGTLKVSARRRLDFGPHGVLVANTPSTSRTHTAVDCSRPIPRRRRSEGL